ncbi:hypothetical protein [Erwinia sp. 198]|uniref:hypothetical protein n=1 Tax=Erwinia sp. 198 TaxID=2022746 RepID=UPI000F675D1C|nr:hypothetical protein [Erwinia sp. 198]
MSRSPGYAVASAIYMSAGLRITLDATLTRITTFGAPVLGAYGYAKAAAEAAERLKILNPIFYTALYNAEIEMLYF